MTQKEQQKAAKKFAETWNSHGYEKGESQKFWMDLLNHIFGIDDFANFVYFENQVHDIIKNKTITNFIDIYIPTTRVMIEQKSSSKDLREPIKQSDGSILTPFQQAKKYITGLPLSQHPRWVVTCNFKSFLVYDMEQPNGEPDEILLENFETEYYRLSFLTDTGNFHLKREMEISIKAGNIVGQIYDALLEQYKNVKNIDQEKCLKSLNMLCVRLVFCLYAEDAGIFGHKSMFGDYLKRFESKDIRGSLLNLFKVLDKKPEERDPFLEEEISDFPYVNGGLFTEEDHYIPHFTDELKDLLVNKASIDFNWSDISPTIFGAVFESTLNPETRRSGGMHYTSIENIHKVIDPLFLDEIKEEFETIKNIKTVKKRNEKLELFQKSIGSIKFLDPACGSGNFLTETYLSLRRLENECLRLRLGIAGSALDLLDNEYKIQVSIHQFYGIEINDFATVVAKTALWIAESQMMNETSNILGRNLEFLPLKSYANIVEENALCIDWKKIGDKASSLNSFSYDYIMGNPPFVGKKEQTKKQKTELTALFSQKAKGIGNLDYVTGWYIKALNIIQNTKTKCSFVSTNSITQGEQVPILWRELQKQNINIDFAYRTFRWNSESTQKANVHCVIIGFSSNKNTATKKIYINENKIEEAENINPYLVNAPTVLIESRSKSICNVQKIMYGSMPIDKGHLILEKEDVETLLKENPENKKFIRKYAGGAELLHNIDRWCLWLKDTSPKEMKSVSFIRNRIKETEQYRRLSNRPQTVQLAETPYLFGEIRQPDTLMLVIPKVSSENRRYIPISFVNPSTIVSGSALIIPDATLYSFGILNSNVHNAWMRTVAGRLKSDYQYSGSVVYNNFPWCNPTAEQKSKIEQTAKKILDVRALYPNCCLADLYDNGYMKPEILKAHQKNDIAVLEAYGFQKSIWKSESKCVAELFNMYEKLVKKTN